jgi:cbb3-type cytochrome oxidase subunit 3
MSAAGLSAYAEVALIIFLAVFMIVAVYVLFSRRQRWEHVARLPLDDEPLSASRAREE